MKLKRFVAVWPLQNAMIMHFQEEAEIKDPQNPENPDSTEHPKEKRARGTAAMDPHTRQEVARKGGLAVSRNKQHMSEIGRKGGQAVSKNREHMAKIGKKGGEASRKTRSESTRAAAMGPSAEKPGLTQKLPESDESETG